MGPVTSSTIRRDGPALGLGARSIEGARAELVSDHHPLDLAHGPARRSLEPLALGLVGRHPRQLAGRGPEELARLQRVRELRELGERFRDPQPLARLAPRAAAVTLDVFGEAGEAERFVDAQAVRGEEPAAELVIERAALPTERQTMAWTFAGSFVSTGIMESTLPRGGLMCN